MLIDGYFCPIIILGAQFANNFNKTSEYRAADPRERDRFKKLDVRNRTHRTGEER